jgi:hypothetical protein
VFILRDFDCLTLEYEALFSSKRRKYLIRRQGIISQKFSIHIKELPDSLRVEVHYDSSNEYRLLEILQCTLFPAVNAG